MLDGNTETGQNIRTITPTQQGVLKKTNEQTNKRMMGAIEMRMRETSGGWRKQQQLEGRRNGIESGFDRG